MQADTCDLHCYWGVTVALGSNENAVQPIRILQQPIGGRIKS